MHLTVLLHEDKSKFASVHIYRVWDEEKRRYVSVGSISYIQVGYLWCTQVPTLEGASVHLIREEEPRGILYYDSIFKAF